MNNYRRKGKEDEQPKTEESIVQSDISDRDDEPTESVLESTIPQVDPEAGLHHKLFVLQHSFNFAKDSKVSAGRMNYKFTSLSYWWDLVQEYFKRNHLYLYWKTKALGAACCSITCVIRDLDSNDTEEATWVIPLSVKTSMDKDGGNTVTTDMLKDGAYLSYFQRRLAFAVCGLITNEDAEAEIEAATSRGSSTKATTTNNVENW